MKIFLIALSVIFMAKSAVSLDLEEVMNAAMDCKKDTGISQDLIVEAQNGDIVEDPKLKKYLKCYYSKMQVLEGENINAERLKSYLEVTVPDKTEEEIEKIAQTCNKKQETAEETASKLAKCITEEKTNMEEEMPEAWIDCTIEKDVSEDIIKKAIYGDFVDDPNLKKALECYYSQLHVMQRGVINTEKLKQYLEITIPNTTSDEIEEIVQDCNKKKESAEETAFELAECLFKYK